MKPRNPPLQSFRLLDQVRERIHYLHYSLRTEKTYLCWVRFYIRWHGRNGKMTQPRDMGAKQVEALLTMLATERNVSASTHNQAFSARLFLYREVLAEDPPWLNDINRPAQVRRIPSVFTKDEVAGLLTAMGGVTALLAVKYPRLGQTRRTRSRCRRPRQANALFGRDVIRRVVTQSEDD